MYIPKRIIINEKSLNDPITKEIINRAESLDKSIEIIYNNSSLPGFPENMSDAERFHYMKESLLVSPRTISFLELFPSPGNIVENPAIMVKTMMHCCFKCEGCYLNKSFKYQQYQRIHSNLGMIENEIKNEKYIYPGIMTLLELASRCSKDPMTKVPDGFNTIANKFRDKLSKKGSVELTYEKVFDHLKNSWKDYLKPLNFDGLNNLTISETEIEKIFEKDKQKELSFNIGEYTDIAGIDHIAGHLDFFIDLLKRNPEFKIRFFTKSAQLDSLYKHDGDNRVSVIMGLNTEHVINNYEHGTSSLDDRIKAIKKLQEKGGYKIRLQIEPIIFYTGYEKDYIDMVGKVMQNIDPKKIYQINIGGLRLTHELRNMCKDFFPQSNFFDEPMQRTQGSYDKLRYDFDQRKTIYRKLIEEFDKHTNCNINLAAETAEMWDELDLDYKEITG